jgi:hypothetical protein
MRFVAGFATFAMLGALVATAGAPAMVSAQRSASGQFDGSARRLPIAGAS